MFLIKLGIFPNDNYHFCSKIDIGPHTIQLTTERDGLVTLERESINIVTYKTTK